MEKYKTRNDVPLKYRWDLTDFYKSDDEFEKELNIISKKLEILPKYAGQMNNSNKLLEFIENDIEIYSNVMNLCVYAMLKSDEDLSNSKAVEYVGKTDELETNYFISISFFEPELLDLDKEEYDNLFNNKKLLKYKPYLDKLYRGKEHSLSKEKKEIVSSLTNTLGSYEQISSTLLNSNHDYGKVIMDDGNEEILMTTNYRIIMKKLSREKRKETYNQFNKVKDQYASTSASLLNNYVKTCNTLARIYNFDYAWNKKLFNLNLTNKVFDSLVEVCISSKDIIEKYNKLKAKVLNVDKLMPWDSPIELYESSKEYTIEEAQNIVLEAIKPLGEDYVNHFKKLIDDRCVDYCQYKNKCSGGYNVSTIGKINSKILMSFNGDLTSISTLAHEGGHFTNHQFIFENNNPIYRNHSNIVGEVASLTNEFLLSDYLSKSNNKDEALAGISNILAVIMSNLFGAVQEGDMEREFYKYSAEGGTLTKDYLYNLTEESLKKFYPIDKLESQYQKGMWISRSHYYMFFYLFSYAICVSVATYVSKEILNGNKEILEKYYKFLSTGSDIYPIDAFKILGIDLEDKKVYENSVSYFDSLIDEFNRIYDKV